MAWIVMKNELCHHGILGMKWGKRNGPPYPLGASDHSASEKKAGWRKSLGGGRNEGKYGVNNKKPQRKTHTIPTTSGENTGYKGYKYNENFHIYEKDVKATDSLGRKTNVHISIEEDCDPKIAKHVESNMTNLDKNARKAIANELLENREPWIFKFPDDVERIMGPEINKKIQSMTDKQRKDFIVSQLGKKSLYDKQSEMYVYINPDGMGTIDYPDGELFLGHLIFTEIDFYSGKTSHPGQLYG